MRQLFLLVLFLIPITCMAQPDLESLQQEWVTNVKKGLSVADFSWEKGYLMFMDVEVTGSESVRQLLRNQGIEGLSSYAQEQIFKHNDDKYVSVGMISTDEEEKLLLLSGWRNVGESWEKEIDIMLTRNSAERSVNDSIASVLNEERNKWIELANEHAPAAHIAYSYTPDAVYFSNGDRSDGHAGISERYSYMENPNYQVDLEKEYLEKVSKKNVLEIGRYYTGKVKKGSGGIYVILWERQEGSHWEIKLDFNF